MAKESNRTRQQKSSGNLFSSSQFTPSIKNRNSLSYLLPNLFSISNINLKEVLADQIASKPLSFREGVARFLRQTNGNYLLQRLAVSARSDIEPPHELQVIKPSFLPQRDAIEIVQRQSSKVVTKGGQFFAKEYYAYETKAAGDRIGAHMNLQFWPNEDLPPCRIGLIQVVRRNAEPSKVDVPTIMNAKIKDKTVTEDLHAICRCPVYGALRDPDEKYIPGQNTLEFTPNPAKTLKKWVTSSHLKVETRGKEKYMGQMPLSVADPIPVREYPIQTGEIGPGRREPAVLKDDPGYSFLSGNHIHKRKQVFSAEVAAVTLEGNSPETYLGSIEWGWEQEPMSDTEPKSAELKPDKIEKVGDLAPSNDFIRAGIEWNKTPLLEDKSGKYEIIKVPVNEFEYQYLAKISDRNLKYNLVNFLIYRYLNLKKSNRYASHWANAYLKEMNKRNLTLKEHLKPGLSLENIKLHMKNIEAYSKSGLPASDKRIREELNELNRHIIEYYAFMNWEKMLGKLINA
jgi:hypothetical protein